MQKNKVKYRENKVMNQLDFGKDVNEHLITREKVLDGLLAGNTKKKKCSSVCDLPVEKLSEQLTSACSLGVLNDTDFRNMLDSALVPRYRKPEVEKRYDGETRRSSDNDKNLSAIATHILAEFRRAADASTDKADRESDEMYSGLTAFIKETDGTRVKNVGKKGLTKSTSQDSKPKRIYEKSTKYGAIVDHNLQNLSKDELPSYHSLCVSSGTETTPKPFTSSCKPDCTIIDIGMDDCIDDEIAAAEDEKTIKYIDEDLPSVEDRTQREISHRVSKRNNLKPEYVRGNMVQELFPMNEERNIVEDCDSCSQSDAENPEFGDGEKVILKEASNENTFSCRSGQLRVHGSKHSSYEMTNTPPVIRDVHTFDNVQRVQPSGPLFSSTLMPANYKPREQFAAQFLTPTDTARLSPTPVVVPSENDMTNNCKNREMEEKHRLAKQRKENRRLKNNKNFITPEKLEGYMGNLDTAEILKKLGEEDKATKVKKPQKTVVVAKESSKSSKSNSGSMKKHKEKRSQQERDDIKGSGASSDSISPSPKHSIKLNGGSLSTTNAGANNKMANVAHGMKPHGEKCWDRRTRSTDVANDNSKIASFITAVIATGEDDDEEQYISADEGVNSIASDEVYHTDELSVSSSHDLMNDAGNYRADDEEVIPNKCSTDEPEFIQVTAKNRKKPTNCVSTSDKKTSNGSSAEKLSSRQPSNSIENVNQRRNSAQLTVDVGLAHMNQQVSPNEHKKFSSAGRRQLNSLADYIEDSTVHQSKIRKNSHHGNFSKTIGNFGQSKTISPQELSKNQAFVGDSLDQRNSQPSGRYAAAVSNSNQSSSAASATTITSVRSSSPQSQLVSPALSSASSSTQSFTQKKKSTVHDRNEESGNLPLLLPGSSISVTEMTNTACATVPGGNCSTSSSVTRSYADIAKRKSPIMASSCVSDVLSRSSPRDTSPEICTASTSTTTEDRCISVTSSAGGSVEMIDKDGTGQIGVVKHGHGDTIASSGVDGITFFYDPNEPATICSPLSLSPEGTESSREFFSPSTPIAVKPQESQENFGKNKSSVCEFKSDYAEEKPAKSVSRRVKQDRKHEKADKTRSGELLANTKKTVPVLVNVAEGGKVPSKTGSSIVLEFEGGRKVVLPSMNAGGALEIDRQKKEMMENAWQDFLDGLAPVRYTPGALRGSAVSTESSK